MGAGIEDLTTPSAFALSQACQAAVGIIEQTPHHAWPDFRALSVPFSVIPSPMTYADALHSSLVLFRFLERAGHEIHLRVHGGEIPRSCPFKASRCLHLTAIDQLHPESWMPTAAFWEWLSTYERELATQHQHTIAERAVNRLRGRMGSATASDIAREVGCSVPVLHRHFGRATGCSMRQYVIRLRVDRAIDLLRRTDWKVEAIAGYVGWRSKKNLHAAFARRVGATPESVRRLDDLAVDDLRRRLHSSNPSGALMSDAWQDEHLKFAEKVAP